MLVAKTTETGDSTVFGLCPHRLKLEETLQTGRSTPVFRSASTNLREVAMSLHEEEVTRFSVSSTSHKIRGCEQGCRGRMLSAICLHLQPHVSRVGSALFRPSNWPLSRRPID